MPSYEKPRQGSTQVWLTPQPIIRDLGPFDLDPCAAPDPRPWPTAAKHITLPQDGLSEEWSGFCWVNPPYSYKDTWPWLDKLGKHPGGGIALIFARTETKGFFDTVWSKAGGLLFVKGRIDFCRPDGTSGRYGHGGAPSVLVGYTDEAMRRLANSSIDGHLVVSSAIVIGPQSFGTWREVIKATMQNKDMRLRDLYSAVEDTTKVRCAKAKGVEWRSKIRRVLQEHFIPVERGVWRLA